MSLSRRIPINFWVAFSVVNGMRTLSTWWLVPQLNSTNITLHSYFYIWTLYDFSLQFNIYFMLLLFLRYEKGSGRHGVIWWKCNVKHNNDREMAVCFTTVSRLPFLSQSLSNCFKFTQRISFSQSCSSKKI